MSGHQAVITCKCGKKYKHFCSYKKHFLSCISIPKHTNQPLATLADTQSFSLKSRSPTISAVDLELSQNGINNPSTAQEPIVSSSIQHHPVIKDKCPFCQLNINSTKLKNHINNICQQRFKNTLEYIELSKLGLITPDLTNKEIRAMCQVIQNLLATGKFNPEQS